MPPLIQKHDVPILTKGLTEEDLIKLKAANTLTEQLMPVENGRVVSLIDGSNHVNSISVLSQINIEAVKMLI